MGKLKEQIIIDQENDDYQILIKQENDEIIAELQNHQLFLKDMIELLKKTENNK
jgi:hypothetical protein